MVRGGSEIEYGIGSPPPDYEPPTSPPEPPSSGDGGGMSSSEAGFGAPPGGYPEPPKGGEEPTEPSGGGGYEEGEPSKAPTAPPSISEKEQPSVGGEPTAPTAPPSIQVIRATSGADSYVVREPLPDGGYKQSIMSKEEIEAKGGTVSAGMERENILHQVETQEGRKAREAKEAELVAQDLGITVEELTKPLSGNIYDQFRQFAEKYYLPLTSTVNTIKDFQLNKNAPQFADMNKWAKRDLERLAEHGNPEISARNIAWQELNEAAKLNPEILKTEWIGGNQTNVLNLEEAINAGIDAQTINWAGRADVRTLVKYNDADEGQLFEHGFEGITPRLLKDVERYAKSSEALSEREKYADWTANELLYGKVTDEGVFTPSPWGMKGSQYITPPLWARAKISETRLAEFEQFKQSHTQLPDGEWIDNESLTEIKIESPDDYNLLMQSGFETYKQEFEANHIRGADDTWMPKEDYAKLTEEQKDIFKNKGYEKLTQSFKAQENIPFWTQVGHEITPWKEEGGEKASVGGGTLMAAEILVPYVYLINRWDDLSPTEKIIIGTLDTASLIPIFWFEARAVSAARRAGVPLARALGRAALTELKAPYLVVRHPLETAKAPFRLARELFGARRVPPEVVIGSIASPAAKEGMSDVRMAVAAGLEESGATLEAMGNLQRAVVASTPAETMQGLRLAEFTSTGLQDILKSPVVVHASPSFENFIDPLLKESRIVVSGEEGGLYAAATGSLFWRGAAKGGGGQIPFEAIIDVGEKGIERLPFEVAKIREPAIMEQVGKKVLGSGIYYDEATQGFKIYHQTAEGEVLITEMTNLVAVPGATKKFKWVEPVKDLIDRATAIQRTMAEKLKEVARLESSLANLSEAEQVAVRNKIEKLLEDAKEIEGMITDLRKEAYARGIPREATLNIDHIEIVDPASGQKIFVPHLAIEGVEAKPWTLAQRAKLKARGYINIPRDILKPALKYPNITQWEVRNRVASRLNPSENERFMAGLRVMSINNLLKEAKGNDILTSKLYKIDLGKVDALKGMPNEVIRRIEDVLRGLDKDARLYGSLVEQTFTGKTVAGDLDIAVNLSKARQAANDIAKVFNDNGFVTRIKAVKAELGKGGAGFGVEVRRGDEWVKIADLRDLREHTKPSPYGWESQPAINLNSGIYIESPVEALQRRMQVMLFPGYGLEYGEKIGAEAAYKLSRLKDIPRTRMLADALLDTYRQEAKNLRLIVGYVDNKPIYQNTDDLLRVLADNIDTLLRGQLPDRITTRMSQALKELGYVDDDIARMTPGEAVSILGKERSASLGVTVGKDFDQITSKFLATYDELKYLSRIRELEDAVAMPRDLRVTTSRFTAPYAETSRAWAMYPYLSRVGIEATRDIQPRVVSETRVPAPQRMITAERVRTPERISERGVVERVPLIERQPRTIEEIEPVVARGLIPRGETPPPEKPPPLEEPYRPVRPPRRETPPIAPPRIPTITSIGAILGNKKEQEEIIKNPPPGTIVWYQGSLKRGDGLQRRYNVIIYPYREESQFNTATPPRGYRTMGWTGKGASSRSLQVLGGKVPMSSEVIDIGAFLVQFRKGKVLIFKKDPKNKDTRKGGNFMENKKRLDSYVEGGVKYELWEDEVIPTGASKAQKEAKSLAYEESLSESASKSKKKVETKEYQGREFEITLKANTRAELEHDIEVLKRKQIAEGYEDIKVLSIEPDSDGSGYVGIVWGHNFNPFSFVKSAAGKLAGKVKAVFRRNPQQAEAIVKKEVKEARQAKEVAIEEIKEAQRAEATGADKEVIKAEREEAKTAQKFAQAQEEEAVEADTALDEAKIEAQRRTGSTKEIAELRTYASSLGKEKDFDRMADAGITGDVLWENIERWRKEKEAVELEEPEPSLAKEVKQTRIVTYDLKDGSGEQRVTIKGTQDEISNYVAGIQEKGGKVKAVRSPLEQRSVDRKKTRKPISVSRAIKKTAEFGRSMTINPPKQKPTPTPTPVPVEAHSPLAFDKGILEFSLNPTEKPERQPQPVKKATVSSPRARPQEIIEVEEEEEAPQGYEQITYVRKKPSRNMKNWWEDNFYEPEQPRQRQSAPAGRTYYGRKLIDSVTYSEKDFQ